MVESGNWRNYDSIKGELYKKSLGIIGFGRIGKNIYKYAKSFDMIVRAYDPNKKNLLKKLNIFSDLNSLLKKSDTIMVCVHLNKKTKELCNDSFLKNEKKFNFVNTSRGEIVKETSLVKALRMALLSRQLLT